MNLREFLGLPIESTKDGLQYNSEEIHIKKIVGFKGIELASFTINSSLNEDEIYKIYQNVYKIEDKELWSETEFSIILLHNGMIGKEYNKTQGYYRNKAENGFRYPEIFQVVEGYAEFLLQQPSDTHRKIKDVVTIRMQRSEVLVVPPSYGITIINPSEKKAIISRLRAADVKESAEEYKDTNGESYFRVEGGKWEYNVNYEEIPMMRLVESQFKWKTIRRGFPIYTSYIYNPNILRTLIEPDPTDFNI